MEHIPLKQLRKKKRPSVRMEDLDGMRSQIELLEAKVEYLMYQFMLLGAMHRWTHETVGGGLFGLGAIGRPSYETMEQRAGVVYLETFGVESPPECPWPILKVLVDDRKEALKKQFEKKMASETENEADEQQQQGQDPERRE